MPIPLWRNRDFLLLWTGQVVSTIGTRVSGLAYPLIVLAITGSAAQAGLVAAAQTAPFLIWFLPAGALVDRWHRKRIMLAADAARAVALASVAVAILLGGITIGYLIVVAFVEGTLYVFFLLAETAALPYVVPRPQLPTAVAQNQARDQGASLIGQPWNPARPAGPRHRTNSATATSKPRHSTTLATRSMSPATSKLPAPAWREALAILDDLCHPHAEQVRAKLSTTTAG